MKIDLEKVIEGELIGVAGPDEEFEPPSYSEPGRMLLEVTGPDENYDREVECHDSDGSVCWIHEGVGVDWWLEQRDIPEIQAPGWYVIEGITGEYIRGDGWSTDDDEEWEYKGVRPATPEEIAGCALCDLEQLEDVAVAGQHDVAVIGEQGGEQLVVVEVGIIAEEQNQTIAGLDPETV